MEMTDNNQTDLLGTPSSLSLLGKLNLAGRSLGQGENAGLGTSRNRPIELVDVSCRRLKAVLLFSKLR